MMVSQALLPFFSICFYYVPVFVVYVPLRFCLFYVMRYGQFFAQECGWLLPFLYISFLCDFLFSEPGGVMYLDDAFKGKLLHYLKYLLLYLFLCVMHMSLLILLAHSEEVFRLCV